MPRLREEETSHVRFYLAALERASPGLAKMTLQRSCQAPAQRRCQQHFLGDEGPKCTLNRILYLSDSGLSPAALDWQGLSHENTMPYACSKQKYLPSPGRTVRVPPGHGTARLRC